MMKKYLIINDYTGKIKCDCFNNIKIIEGDTALDAVKRVYGKNVKRAKDSYNCDVIVEEVMENDNGEYVKCGNMLCYKVV